MKNTLIETGLECSNAQPIYVGDKFSIQEHQGECCNHWITCVVKVDKKCRSGFGLYEIKTNKFIVNADMACYRAE